MSSRSFSGSKLNDIALPPALPILAMVPECKLVPRMANKCQTFVAKLSEYEYTAADKHSWKEALVVEGCHPSAFAIVIVEFATEPGLYIVLTTTQPRHTVCFADIQGGLRDKLHDEGGLGEAAHREAPAALWVG